MVLIVSQNNKHYHSLTIMDLESQTLGTHTREMDIYSYQEAWVSPVSRAVLVILFITNGNLTLVNKQLVA